MTEKLEEVEVFFGRLHEHSMSMNAEDNLVWLVIKNGSFLVKSFYSSLLNNIFKGDFEASLRVRRVQNALSCCEKNVSQNWKPYLA